jgi:hypothetical protein
MNDSKKNKNKIKLTNIIKTFYYDIIFASPNLMINTLKNIFLTLSYQNKKKALKNKLI